MMMKANLIFKTIEDKTTEFTVAGKTRIELFPKIFEKIKTMKCECSIKESDIAAQYNKWCQRHTNAYGVVPEEITNYYQARCGYAVPYSESYKMTLRQR